MIEQTAYPDTAAGALRLLLEDSDLGEDALMGATARPDAYVEGCWLVTLRDGRRFLAYVAGHALAPDFEDVGRPEPWEDMDGGLYHAPEPREPTPEEGGQPEQGPASDTRWSEGRDE